MFKGLSGLNVYLYNILLILIWHLIAFFVCIKMPHHVFDPSKDRYHAWQWERGGRFYREKLKIQLWKDRVPQYIGKHGFSKQHLTGVSIQYLDEFLMETCRGEWLHTINLICAVIVLIVNTFVVGLIYFFLVILGNVPFVMIQRYNRFRLAALRKRKLREQHCGMVAAQGITAQSY